MINLNNGITHSGVFHADDVFSTALLKIINPNFTFKRIKSEKEIPKNFNGIIYDIGRGKYDHHQQDNEIRDNGCPYASLGKIWRDFADLILDDDNKPLSTNVIAMIDEKYIQKIDYCDNTGDYSDSPFSSIISFLNPINRDKEDENVQFNYAVEMAMTLFKRFIDKCIEIQKQVDFIYEHISNSSHNILVIPKYVNINTKEVKSILTSNDIYFVVYPALRGGYNMQQVKYFNCDTAEEYSKMIFPESWLSNKNLPSPINFCHKGNWLLAFTADNLEKAKETAINISQRCCSVSLNGID